MCLDKHFTWNCDCVLEVTLLISSTTLILFTFILRIIFSLDESNPKAELPVAISSGKERVSELQFWM